MREREPTNYLGERIRELVVAHDGQLGIEVEITADSVIIRGLVNPEHRASRCSPRSRHGPAVDGSSTNSRHPVTTTPRS